MSVVELPEAFANASGLIQNLVTEPNGGVAIIRSFAGTTRSHHYHRTDAHWLYVLSGEMFYYERPVGDPAPAKLLARLTEGQMIYTGPMIEHVTHFPVDTVLVSISKLSRTHENHESDVVRVHVPTDPVVPEETHAAHHPV